MTTIHIWHRYQHDQFTVSTRIVKDKEEWVSHCYQQGGFWLSLDNQPTFIPWHSISFITEEI